TQCDRRGQGDQRREAGDARRWQPPGEFRSGDRDHAADWSRYEVEVQGDVARRTHRQRHRVLRDRRQRTAEQEDTALQGYIFTVDCAERPGVLRSVPGALLAPGGDIKELRQFDDQYTQRLFLRIDFRVSDEPGNGIGGLRKDFESLAEEFDAKWQLWPQGQKRRVLIMVSKFEHCLNDLL